ncbi:MAG: FAD-dependent oxidoreductase [Bacillota bacterium]|nr:FAD-dependent oxidoreductase [Bacillota bacterium]
MNLVSGDLFWTSINRIPNSYTYLTENIDCDIVIIGGGVTGALCAYYLTKAGINVVLVDKNIIGYGSTSASTSILQYEIDNNLIGLKNHIGINNSVDCFNLCQKSLYDIDKIINEMDDKCNFNIKDCFYYSNKESDVPMLKKEYALRKEHGFNVELFDDNSSDKFSFPFKAGIYSKNSAGEIDPYKFTHSLISTSVKQKLRVYENTLVTSLKSQIDGVTVVTKNKFKIRAKKAIIATGYEAKKFISKKIVTLTRTFAVVTKPINEFKGWYNRAIIRDTNDFYSYLRVTDDNRIIIGGEDLEIGGERSKVSNLKDDDPLAGEKYTILTNRLKALFPQIPNIEVDFGYSALFGDTKDSLPYIGEYEDIPNCYFCLGYGSNGILYAVFGAQFLRDLYLGNPPKELNLFRIDR